MSSQNLTHNNNKLTIIHTKEHFDNKLSLLHTVTFLQFYKFDLYTCLLISDINLFH